MKPRVKAYEFIIDENRNVKKVSRGIYKNMAYASQRFEVHNSTMSAICHGKRKWVEVDGRTYSFKFTNKDYTKTI